MSYPRLAYTRVMIIILCFIGLINCASNKTEQNIPVSWNSGFIMPELLASSDITLANVGDLSKLIEATWYASLDVGQTKVGESIFSSCKDYFDKAEPSTRTKRDYEMNSYLEFKVMCEATRLLINASSSKESFLPDNVLGADLPKLWPKEMAQQISVQESRRSAQNPELKTLADVTPITKYESHSKTKSIYFHEGGYQEMEILGNGDTNNDEIEDVFMIARDYVEGGTYFNIRLFVLSVNAQGDWKLIKDI